jgi:hypothetical protein
VLQLRPVKADDRDAEDARPPFLIQYRSTFFRYKSVDANEKLCGIGKLKLPDSRLIWKKST